MRDAFAVLFFVSVGMLFDPVALLESWPLALATLGIVMLGKPLAAFVVVRLLGKPMRLALSVSVALAQIGEFSFILGAMGVHYKVLPSVAGNALIAAAVVSIALNSLLYRCIPGMLRLLERCGIGRSKIATEDRHELVEEDKQRVIVIGYGPSGRIMCRILVENNIDVAIIEMNIDTVLHLRSQGIKAVYGDARQRDVLTAAGVLHASGLIVSSAGAAAHEVMEAARALNPEIAVVIHTTFMREAHSLRKGSEAVVFAGECEVAMSMAEHLLRQFGATDEHIEKERRRIHDELRQAG